MFWLCAVTAKTFTAWVAGLSNWKGRECSDKDKVMFFGGKEGNRIWYLLQVSWAQALLMLKAIDGGKKGWWTFNHLISQSFNKILCWSREWLSLVRTYFELRICPTLCVYRWILGRFFQDFSAKQLNRRKISPFFLLPGNAFLLQSLLHSLLSQRITWLIPCRETVPPDSQLMGSFLAQEGESAASALSSPGRAGWHSPGAIPSCSAQKAKEEQDTEVGLRGWKELHESSGWESGWVGKPRTSSICLK